MAVSSTFGYHPGEDRIWLGCDVWPQRVWITRRMACELVQATVHRLEAPPDADADADAVADARPAPERAAAAHDASLNKPQPGERGLTLKTGREASDAPALQGAVLCTRFTLTAAGDKTELTFHTAAGQRRLHLSRTGLHRWLHALHLVLRGTGWADWTPAPDWLRRSYLPPALRQLLHTPPSPAGRGDDENGDEDGGAGARGAAPRGP